MVTGGVRKMERRKRRISRDPATLARCQKVTRALNFQRCEADHWSGPESSICWEAGQDISP